MKSKPMLYVDNMHINAIYGLFWPFSDLLKIEQIVKTGFLVGLRNLFGFFGFPRGLPPRRFF